VGEFIEIWPPRSLVSMSEEFEYRPLGEIGRRLEQACAALEKGGLLMARSALVLDSLSPRKTN